MPASEYMTGPILVSAPNLKRLRQLARKMGRSSTFDDVITHLLECRDQLEEEYGFGEAGKAP